MKFKRYLNMILSGIGFFIVGWFAFLHPDWILYYGIFTPIAGIVLILCCLLPIGKLRLGEPNSATKISYGQWWWACLKGQGALFFFTLAAIFAFLVHGPALDPANNPFPLSKEVLTHTIAWQWGFFPWAVYGLWGIILAYATYVKKGIPYYYQIGHSILPKFLEPSTKTYVEASLYSSTLLALSLMIVAIILLFSYAIEGRLHWNHFAVPIITVMLLSLFSWLIFLKSARKWFVGKPPRRHFNRFCTVTILSMLFLLLLIAAGNQWFVTHYQDIYQKMVCHECQRFFENVPLQTRFAALYWGWWLIWTPLAGSYLAAISQGRSIREFVIGLLIVPAIFWTLFYSLDLSVAWGWLVLVIQKYDAIFQVFFAAGTWMILTKMLVGQKNSNILISGFMPIPENALPMPTKLNGISKSEGLTKFFQKILMLIFSTLFIFTMAGWFGIQFQVVATGFFIINALYVGFELLLIQWFKDKAWKKDQIISPY